MVTNFFHGGCPSHHTPLHGGGVRTCFVHAFSCCNLSGGDGGDGLILYMISCRNLKYIRRKSKKKNVKGEIQLAARSYP